MKIYAFDDKEQEMEKAHAAILGAGHELFPGRGKDYIDISRSAVELAQSKNEPSWTREGASDRLFYEIGYAIDEAKKTGGGIITDLMFHISSLHLDKALTPSGLLVVIHALSAGVPVVVCTDASEVGGHHAEAVSWIFDGYVSRFIQKGRVPPFGWVEDKNWGEAVAMLAEMRSKMDSLVPPQ